MCRIKGIIKNVFSRQNVNTALLVKSFNEKYNPLFQKQPHQRFSVRKGVLRNFAKFTGKHLCQNLFFNKVTGLRPATLLKTGVLL